MEYWYPEKKRRQFVKRPRRIRFGRFWQFRVYDNKQMARLRRIVYTNILFMFTIKIGSSIYFYFSHPVLPHLIEVSWKLEVPRAKSAEKLHGFRDVVVISIDKSGLVSFNGYQFERSMWQDVLYKYKIHPMHPTHLIALMVDANCPMSKVYDVFSELREVGILDVSFAVRPMPMTVSELRPKSDAHATWFSIVVLTIVITLLVFYAARKEKTRRLVALNRIYERSTTYYMG